MMIKNILLAATVAFTAYDASALSLNVDSAPNKFGSPSWSGWWAQAQTDVVAGTFQDMRTGTYPGTLTFDPLDEIVYSTGDLGKRIHWIYWIPGETIASLDQRFEVRYVIDWEGENWTVDSGGNWILATADNGWAQPQSWENYNDGTNSGVIGSFGLAFWAADDQAAPFNTNASLYDETNAADIESLRQDIFAAQTFARGEIRLRGGDAGTWQTLDLQINMVPDAGASAALLGIAGLAMVAARKRD